MLLLSRGDLLCCLLQGRDGGEAARFELLCLLLYCRPQQGRKEKRGGNGFAGVDTGVGVAQGFNQ